MLDTLDEQLQHAINLSAEYGREDAAKKLGVKEDTIRRYENEARERGMKPEGPVKKPNVLVFDIETSLMEFYAWSPGKQYVGPSQIIKDWYVLSWASKWLFEPDVFSDVLTPEEGLTRNDERIVRSIWKFLDHADIIIGHNIKKFDVRKLNARFIFYDLKPPSPYLAIDTLTSVRSVALFSSNKQDELCKKCGLSRKVEHEGYDLWVKCANGDPDALLRMEEYNIGDIMGVEELYVRLRPWIKSHPNMNLFVEGNGDGCPNCGSGHIKWMDKFYVTSVNKYSTFRCRDCGAIGRSRHSSLSKENKPDIVSISR